MSVKLWGGGWDSCKLGGLPLKSNVLKRGFHTQAFSIELFQGNLWSKPITRQAPRIALKMPAYVCLLKVTLRELPKSFSHPCGPWLLTSLCWRRHCRVIRSAGRGHTSLERGSFPKMPVAPNLTVLHAYCKLRKEKKRKPPEIRSSATMLSFRESTHFCQGKHLEPRKWQGREGLLSKI